MMKKLAIVLFLLAASGQARAKAPFLVNYQGKLMQNGVPVNGDRPVLFRIYNAPSGGSELWAGDVQTVHITNGVFQAMVGQATSMGSPTAFSNIDWSSNDRYLEIQVSLDVLQPRERLTSVPYSFFANNGVPSGAILMWSGPIASIPEGWALCDGQVHNGRLTPDLRDRFLTGAGSTYNPGDQGGSASHSHTVNAHTHTIDHTQNIAHTHGMDHTHTYSGTTANTSINDWVDRATSSMRWQPWTDPHSHTYSGTTSGASTVNTGGASPATSSFSGASGAASPGTSSANSLPPYYALAFIMKL